MSRKGTDVRRNTPSPPKPAIPNWLIIFVVLVVLAMWVGSTIYSTRNPDWPIPPSIHAAAIAIITGIGGFFVTRGRGNGA